jgi:hypothetical protein
MYSISYKGRVYQYQTLEDATKLANAIFDATKIVVGIFKCPRIEADPYERHWSRNRAFNVGKASLINE